MYVLFVLLLKLHVINCHHHLGCKKVYRPIYRHTDVPFHIQMRDYVQDPYVTIYYSWRKQMLSQLCSNSSSAIYLRVNMLLQVFSMKMYFFV